MIVFDASPAVHRKAGLGRYAEELLGALVFSKPGAAPATSGVTALYHDAAAAKPSALVQALPRIAIQQTPYPWRLRALLANLLNLSQDGLLAPVAPDQRSAGLVFHATEHLLPRFKRARVVFTLHDLIFRALPQYHLPRNRIFLNLAMPVFLRRADAIIAVSEFTKQDAIKAYGVPEHKITVIPEAVHPRFKRVTDADALQAARDAYGLPARFVLSLSTIEPRKNFPTLIRAFAEYVRASNDKDIELIIVGKQGWLFEETYRSVHESGMTGRVRFLGYIDDDSLPALYSLATVFAFASVYEGFGFTPLEALACGAPVLCSNATSLPEVVGDAGVLLPPTDIGAWAQALTRALTDAAWRRDLSARGPSQAAKFSWQKAAAATMRVYEEVDSDS
jgi:glycosyltransferase involved in cell wall biosynthesis